MKRNSAAQSKEHIISTMKKTNEDQLRRLVLLEQEARVLSARRKRERELDRGNMDA